MVFLVGVGLTQLFILLTVLQTILQVLSVMYLIYLAYKIAVAHPNLNSNEGKKASKPMTFLQAVLFQWVNPKAWTMSMTAIGLYSPEGSLRNVILVSGIFGIINFPCITAWLVLGKNIRRFLKDPSHLRIFNITMATLLVGTLYFVFYR